MTEAVEARSAIARTAKRIADHVLALPRSDSRRLVAIAGAPGSGKSTVAEAVAEELNRRGQVAVVMPMDGFHLDNRLLEPRGLLPRKGAPETFDFGGFAATLKRVKNEPSVILPVFDRSREIAIAGAEEIGAATGIVVVEGNYLVLDENPWRELAKLWDYSVFLDVPFAELERRLIARWLGYGYEPEEAREKALGNDIPNARRVLKHALAVDLRVSG